MKPNLVKKEAWIKSVLLILCNQKNIMQTFLSHLVYGLFWLISLLPLRVLYWIFDIVYIFVKRFYRKRVVHDNLVKSFPDKTADEIAKIERDFYHVFCDYFAEDIKSFSMSKKEMMRRVVFSEESVRVIREQFENGKDYVFAYLGHYCNWEWMASFAYWMPFAHCAQLYSPLQNKVFDQVFLKLRQQYGGECIPMAISPRRLIQLRNEGKKLFVAFIADQLPQWKGIHHYTPFLQRDTAVFTGAEQMAKKFNASVIYSHLYRPKRGHYYIELELMTAEPKAQPDYDITDTFMRMLEQDIVRTPHLWLWTHKRWRRTKEEWLERQKKGNVD